MQLDCTDEDSIANAASQVSGTHKHLDLLLNVAGILHVPGKMSPGQLQRQLLLSMTMLDVSYHVGSWFMYCCYQSSMQMHAPSPRTALYDMPVMHTFNLLCGLCRDSAIQSQRRESSDKFPDKCFGSNSSLQGKLSIHS